MEWIKSWLGRLGCREEYYKKMLEIEKKRSSLWKEDSEFQKNSYNELLELFFKLSSMLNIEDEQCIKDIKNIKSKQSKQNKKEFNESK